jgi:hypothetical protein
MTKLHNICFNFDMCRLEKVEWDLDAEIWNIFDSTEDSNYIWIIPGEFE